MTPPPSADSKAFRDFEHAGWEEAGTGYHQHFCSLTSQAIGPLLDAVRVREGARLLDVATGAGYAAAGAAERGAVPVGIDFSAAQVALAHERYPSIAFREGDAEALPFADASFDAVVMNFGLLHFPQPERAVAEARRVLRSGGRFGFTVWAKPEEAVGLGIVLGAIEAHGDPNVMLPPGPPFFRFSDADEARRVLLGAGFAGAEVAQIPQTWRFASPDAVFEAIAEGTVRTRALLAAQSGEAQDAIRTAIRDAATGYLRAGVVELPMDAVLASAEKP